MAIKYLDAKRIQGSSVGAASATFSEDNTSDNFTQVIETSGVPLSPETRWGVDYQNVYVKTVGQQTLFNDDTLNFDGDTIKGGMRYTGTPDNGSLRSVKVYIKKTGSPTGSVYMKLYKNQTLGSGATSATETSTTTLDISTLTTTYSYVTFTFAGTNTIETNDIIAIEYPSGGSGSNKLNVGWDAGTGTAGWSIISMYGTSSPANQWANENTGRSATWVIKAGSNKGLTVNAARNNGSQGEYISLGSTYSSDFICRFSYKALVPSDEWSYGSGSESYAPYLHVGLCSLNTCDSNTSQNFAGIQHLPMAGDSKPYVCFAHATGSIQGQSSGGGLSGSWTGSNSVEDGTTVDQYYAEIVKDGTTVTVNFYTDSTYETLYGTNSITRSSSETDSYSYFVAMGMDFATNPYGSMSVFIDDIQIWKDTTTPTGDEKATITNVPTGTRYEETDTRKIFRRNDIKGTWTERGVAEASRGVFCGGESSASDVNTMDYITIGTLGNATDFGDMVLAREGMGSCSSLSRGVVAGGNVGGSTDRNEMDYITTWTTGNATDFGDSTISARYRAGCASTAGRGLFAGGFSTSGSTFHNVIEYITIASTGNATDFGDMTVGHSDFGGCDNGTRGIFAGGQN